MVFDVFVLYASSIGLNFRMNLPTIFVGNVFLTVTRCQVLNFI